MFWLLEARAAHCFSSACGSPTAERVCGGLVCGGLVYWLPNKRSVLGVVAWWAVSGLWAGCSLALQGWASGLSVGQPHSALALWEATGQVANHQHAGNKLDSAEKEQRAGATASAALGLEQVSGGCWKAKQQAQATMQSRQRLDSVHSHQPCCTFASITAALCCGCCCSTTFFSWWLVDQRRHTAGADGLRRCMQRGMSARCDTTIM